MNSNKLAVLGIVAALVIGASIVSFVPAASALQSVSQKNRAGGNTQTGLVNVGNAQVDVGANVCAVATNC